MNSIVGDPIAIVSPMPQTTQKNMRGICTGDNFQIVFVDTPGIHMGKHKLNRTISEYALSTITDQGIDIVCYLVDLSRDPGPEEGRLAEVAVQASEKKQVVLIFNKVDLFTIDKAMERKETFLQAYPGLADLKTLMISSTADNAGEVFIDFLKPLLPEGPMYYPADEISDSHLRHFAAEYVRKQIISLTYQEVPHAAYVEIISYTEKDGLHEISADIHVETTGQKKILIGSKGATIARIRRQSEWRMRKLTGDKVKFSLFVKVTPHWRDKVSNLKEFGFLE
jgi:GTP-binding protein Era